MSHGETEKSIHGAVARVHHHRFWCERVAIHGAERYSLYRDDDCVFCGTDMVWVQCQEHTEKERRLICYID